MRKIIIADMRSFYASVEQALNPALKGKPLIVSADPHRKSGVVLAASPEAKRFGIKNAITCGEAQLACPQAVVVKPHMALYLKYSMDICTIANRFTDLVEVYSIDELFMDVTHVGKLRVARNKLLLVFSKWLERKRELRPVWVFPTTNF